MVILRDSNLLVQNKLPKADQVEKLKKDRSIYIYAGKPSDAYKDKYGSEGRIQIGDKYTDITKQNFSEKGAFKHIYIRICHICLTSGVKVLKS